MSAVRVLIVDDSSLVRQILSAGLSRDPGIEVIGTAKDAYEARDLIVRLNPDVLTLDVEMPRMDGVTFLRKLMQFKPMPVVMVSTLTKERAAISLEALELGAVDIVAKPAHNIGARLSDMMADLRTTVKMAARARVRPAGARRAAPPSLQRGANLPSSGAGVYRRRLLALGASTGGTQALQVVLSGLPADTPGTVIVQHMPAAFTGAFAQRLNRTSAMTVVEGVHGMQVLPGRAIVAPGGKQMRVIPKGGGLLVTISEGPLVQGHAPSVDVLFQSVAQHVGLGAVGAVLTGMGADGAAGLLAMRNAGARTIAQDEATSIVYGMPKVAATMGGAELIRPLDRISAGLTSMLRSPMHRAA